MSTNEQLDTAFHVVEERDASVVCRSKVQTL